MSEMADNMIEGHIKAGER